MRFDQNRVRSGLYAALTFCIALAGLIYAVARAHYLSITHDEALTVIRHAFATVPQIITFYMPDPNNQLLNTLLIKGFIAIFGLAELPVRIPALLGYILYASGVCGILKLFLKRQYLIPAMCIMIFQPFLMDFFSLARGYSLGIGFLMPALYYIFRRAENVGERDGAVNTMLAVLMLTLSMLSNLAMIHVYFGMTAVLALLGITEGVHRLKIGRDMKTAVLLFVRNTCVPISVSLVILSGIYAGPVIRMSRVKQLYVGGNNGFWADTVDSLVRCSLYGKAYGSINVIGLIKPAVISVFLISLMIVCCKAVRNRKFSVLDRYFTACLSVIALTVVTAVLGHVCFGVTYPMDRTGLYFIPLFLILLILFLAELEAFGGWLRAGSAAALGAIFVITMVHFINCANLKYCHLWKYDACTKEMMSDMVTIQRKGYFTTYPVRLGAYWIFEPSINFYYLKNKMAWMMPTNRKQGLGGRYDLYYLPEPDIMRELGLKGDLPKARAIKKYKVSNTYLGVRGG
ncbi:MAG: hypothetical protein ABH885_01525 [Candidatus Omnitrophota bacterium]